MLTKYLPIQCWPQLLQQCKYFSPSIWRKKLLLQMYLLNQRFQGENRDRLMQGLNAMHLSALYRCLILLHIVLISISSSNHPSITYHTKASGFGNSSSSKLTYFPWCYQMYSPQINEWLPFFTFLFSIQEKGRCSFQGWPQEMLSDIQLQQVSTAVEGGFSTSQDESLFYNLQYLCFFMILFVGSWKYKERRDGSIQASTSAKCC